MDETIAFNPLTTPPLEVAPDRKYAAFVMFLCDGHMLILQRSDNGSWGFPGGTHEGDEDLEETAIRECAEEMGFRAARFCKDLVPWIRTEFQSEDGSLFDCTTFLCTVPEQFTPKLNSEHIKSAWVAIDEILTNGLVPVGTDNVRQLVAAQVSTGVE